MAALFSEVHLSDCDPPPPPPPLPPSSSLFHLDNDACLAQKEFAKVTIAIASHGSSEFSAGVDKDQ